MSIYRLISAIVLCLALSTSALAQQAPAQGDTPGQGPAGNNSMVTLDVSPFIKAVDTDKDGNITTAEWKAAGLNEAVFTVFDSENKNTFSEDVMAQMSHPAEMDADKDGKLTLDEFKNATKDIGAQGGPGDARGGAPGGAPQQ